jgi:hypothetical protein
LWRPTPFPQPALLRVEKGGSPLVLVTETAMFDVMYLAIGFGFLAVAVLYVVACDRL